jgi:hypothetical protein
MGFFDVDRPAEPETVPEEKPWDSQTAPWVGGVVPLEAVVARSDDAAVVVSRIEAYPYGLHMTVRACLHRSVSRRRSEGVGRHMGCWDQDPDAPIPAEFLRVGLEWPDGGKATNLNAVWTRTSPPLDQTHGMESQGGGGGNNEYSSHFWCWPTPSEGQLRLVVEWPAFGISETDFMIDGAAIGQAARRARPVWESDADLPSYRTIASIMRINRR